MKKILALGLIGLLVGCDKPQAPSVTQQPVVVDNSKVVAAKQDTMESRFNAASYLMGGSSHKATTVHYLVASDGAVCEVTLGQYALAKIGEKFACADGWSTQ